MQWAGVKEKSKPKDKPKFYQAVLEPVKDVIPHVYGMGSKITLKERLGDGKCPECNNNEWILLAKESAAVRQGGKPYIECKSCGYNTHL